MNTWISVPDETFDSALVAQQINAALAQFEVIDECSVDALVHGRRVLNGMDDES